MRRPRNVAAAAQNAVEGVHEAEQDEDTSSKAYEYTLLLNEPEPTITRSHTTPEKTNKNCFVYLHIYLTNHKHN